MASFCRLERPDINNSSRFRFIPGPGQYTISSRNTNYQFAVSFAHSKNGFELIDGKLFNTKHPNNNPGPGSYNPKVSYNSLYINKNNNHKDSSQMMNSSDSLSSHNIISKDQIDNNENQILEQQQQYIFDQDQEIFL